MGLRGPKASGKQTATIRLEQHIIESIRRLSAKTGKSQSEIVDLWREVYAAALIYVQSTYEIETTAAYQRLEELLK